MDNSTPDIPGKLIRYLDGELGEAEKQVFEEQLVSNPVLREELENLRIAREAVRQYGLRKQVGTIHNEMTKEQQVPIRKIGSVRRMIRYSIAAAASVLVLAGGIVAYQFFSLSPEKVFASRYQSYELTTARSNGTPDKPIEKAYREKKFDEVIRIHQTGEDNSIVAEFLNGMAFLETNDPAAAIQSFREVLTLNKQTATSLMNDEAEYYLALAHLKNRDYDLSLELFTKIRENKNHLYHSKVTNKLIRELKWLKSR